MLLQPAQPLGSNMLKLKEKPHYTYYQQRVASSERRRQPATIRAGLLAWRKTINRVDFKRQLVEELLLLLLTKLKA